MVTDHNAPRWAKGMKETTKNDAVLYSRTSMARTPLGP